MRRREWTRLDPASGREFRPAIRDDPDVSPALAAGDVVQAAVHVSLPKQAISIRIDREVLEWFKSLGPGYQTRMNMILRGYMERHREQPEEPEA